ncbi:MAG: hypothetical protein JW395_2770 [Nitrospira sp.]|nr:hypothetical protein [Nitrospira sp.]
MLAHPLRQILKRAVIFLNHKDSRLSYGLQRQPQASCHLLIEVFNRVRKRYRSPSGIESSHSDESVSLLRQELGAVTTDKALVDPYLSLVPEIVVHTSDDDDDAVPGIRRLANEADVIGRLS